MKRALISAVVVEGQIILRFVQSTSTQISKLWKPKVKITVDQRPLKQVKEHLETN